MARTRALYIVMLVLSAAAVLALGSWPAFIAFYSLLLLPVAAAFSLAIYPKMSGAFFIMNRRQFFKGESHKATLRARNYSIFAYPVIEITLRDDLAIYDNQGENEGGIYALAPFGGTMHEYNISFPYRGIYEVGIKSSTVTDFLGLFKLRFRGKNTAKVTVYPKIIEDFTLPLNQKQLSEGDYGIDRFSDDWADVSDVRRHDPSDDYRKIHWKLSAKRGEFIVKNYRTPGLNKTLVIIDTLPLELDRRDKAEYEDTVVSFAASAVDFCLKNRQAVRIIYGDGEDDGLDLASPRDMESALELLAMLPFEGKSGAVARAVHAALIGRQSFADIVVFVSRIELEVCSVLKEAFSAGHNVFLYYVCPIGSTPTHDDYTMLDDVMNHGLTVEILK